MKKRFTCFSILLLILFSKNLNGQGWIPSGDFDLPNGWGVSTISIVDENTVWAAAINWFSNSVTPKVYRTLNGGENWEGHPVPGGLGKQLYSIAGLNDSTALVTTNDNQPWNGPGGAKVLYKTTDGGQTWQAVLQHNAGGYILHFFDQQHGVCINQDDVAFTENGGDTWTLVDGDSIPDLGVGETAGGFFQTISSSLAVVGDTLWMGTSQGRVFRSDNRGKKWSAFSTGLGNNEHISSVAFSDAKNGLATYIKSPFNEFMLARTDDGGESWVPISAQPGIKLREFIYIPGTQNMFIGSSYFDPPQTVFLNDYGDEWIIIDDSLSINALAFSSQQLGWSADGSTNPAMYPEVYKWDSGVSIIGTVQKLKDIAIFPIPFENELTVRSVDLVIQKVKVYDLNGKVFFVKDGIGRQEIHFFLPNLPPGIFFIEVETKEGRLARKLVKN